MFSFCYCSAKVDDSHATLQDQIKHHLELLKLLCLWIESIGPHYPNAMVFHVHRENMELSRETRSS